MFNVIFKACMDYGRRVPQNGKLKRVFLSTAIVKLKELYLNRYLLHERVYKNTLSGELYISLYVIFVHDCEQKNISIINPAVRKYYGNFFLLLYRDFGL